jgi:hypothetical protein
VRVQQPFESGPVGGVSERIDDLLSQVLAQRGMYV